MGNAIDKDGGEVSNCDTLARDITYKNYSNEKLNEIPASKQRNGRSGSSKGVSRSNSKTRRQSFRGRKAVQGSIKRVMSREKKSASPTPAVGLLLSDMEIQVDGKVAKLVPRKSVVNRMSKASPKQLRRDSSKKVKSVSKTPALAKLTAIKTSATKDSSVKHQSAGLSVHKTVPSQLIRKSSYDAAVSTQDHIDERLSHPAALPKPEWNHANFSRKQNLPSKDISSVNMNNNNSNKTANKPEFVGLWRLDEAAADKVSKRRSSGCEVYREISSQLNKLALVSPISDV